MFASGVDLDRPDAILRALRVAIPSPAPFDRAEARALLDEARSLIADPLTEGQPPDWQWNLRTSLDLLRRLAGGEEVTLTDALSAIRVNVIAHRWHIDHLGTDRLGEIRWRFVALAGRFALGVAPEAWELELLGRPPGAAFIATPAERMRRRREALGLSQSALARKLGVGRSTVVRWEAGERRPTPTNAALLAVVLGGVVADYGG